MKAVFAAMALVGATICQAETNATAARIAALKDSFRFAPVAANASGPLVDEDPAVMLERMTITESMSRRALAHQIETRWEVEHLAEFNWSTGGRIFTGRIGTSRAEYGLWPILEERILGITSTRLIALKLQLVRVRW